MRTCVVCVCVGDVKEQKARNRNRRGKKRKSDVVLLQLHCFFGVSVQVSLLVKKKEKKRWDFTLYSYSTSSALEGSARGARGRSGTRRRGVSLCRPLGHNTIKYYTFSCLKPLFLHHRRSGARILSATNNPRRKEILPLVRGSEIDGTRSLHPLVCAAAAVSSSSNALPLMQRRWIHP